MRKNMLVFYVKFINWLYSKNIPVRFLVGANQILIMRNISSGIISSNYQAQGYEIGGREVFLKSWADEFRSHPSFSARFHHTIPAQALGLHSCSAFKHTEDLSNAEYY
ncbi:MAG: hypothetical protein CM15mP111_4240 [Hyphomicrobiales bacterium]|nr:MAG: hypothetical protein CM15mP111_4240 [Hyphomicrobiales bacterium]